MRSIHQKSWEYNLKHHRSVFLYVGIPYMILHISLMYLRLLRRYPLACCALQFYV